MRIEKICFITDRYPTEDYPVNTFLDQLVCQIADMGVKCTVIAPFSPLLDKLKKNNYNPPEHRVKKTKNGAAIDIFCPAMPFVFGKKILNIDFHKLYCKVFSRTAQKAFKRYNVDADVLYAHFVLPAGFAASDLARKYNKPYFIAYGESSLGLVTNTYKIEYVRQKLADIAGMIAVSTKNKEEIVSNGVLSSEKASVFPNAIDSKSFYKIDQLAVRKELGIPEDSFIVAFVGHYIHRKGTKRLSKAIDKLSGVNSFFIGAGEETPDCQGILFSGRLPHEKVVKYLNAADVFVLPTLAEGCCNAIVEAMACGLPIISSDLPFNDDILNDSNAIRIDPNNVNEIAEAIKTLKEDVQLRQRLSQNALRMAESLSLDKRAKAIYSFMTEKTECGG